jgi:hypothetical protein
MILSGANRDVVFGTHSSSNTRWFHTAAHVLGANYAQTGRIEDTKIIVSEAAKEQMGVF